MEISQLGLSALLLYSAIGGGLLGVIYELWTAIRLILRLLLDPYGAERFCPPYKIYARLLPQCDTTLSADGIKKSWTETAVCVTEFVGDALFAVIGAIILIAVSYSFNAGRMRWMIYVGFALGFGLYRILFSRPTRILIFTAILFVRKLVLKILSLLLAPIKWLKIKLKGISQNCKKRKNKKGENKP